MKLKSIKEIISTNNVQNLKLKAVLSAFPDAQINSSGIIVSKDVNNKYTHLDFENHWALTVKPHCLVDVEIDNIIHQIKVYSLPMKLRLAYRKYKPKGSVIAFNRLKFNIKEKNFDDSMLKECQKQIMNYIAKYPKLELDKKHLDKKLKDMLAFI